MQTPVAFIIFNRPDFSQRVFAEIARARPKKLFVIADGPRPDRPGDEEKCAAARAIVERVDWECEVFRDYSEKNLGCGRRISSGISWVFEQVEQAIILEDDCVPHPTFFRYCEELLERYRDDERVMLIGGTNDLFGRKHISHSYYFSRIPGIWGWATWRRAWQHFDMKIRLWPELRDTAWLMDILGDPRTVEYWGHIFDKAYAGSGDVSYWGYQWLFACWAQNGFVIMPNTNLVSNIGFGDDATHTTNTKDSNSNIPTEAMKFPLEHPPYVVRDREADLIRFGTPPPPPRGLYRKIRTKLSATIPRRLRKPISKLLPK